MKPARHNVDAVHALGSCQNALIVVWRGVPTPTTLESVRRAAEELLAEFPDGIGVLGVSGNQLPLDAADDRQRLAPVIRQLGDRLLGLASVIEGSEQTRHLLASINLVVKQPCPLGIFSNIDAGVVWLAPLLGGTRPSSTALRHAVEGLRRELPSAGSVLN